MNLFSYISNAGSVAWRSWKLHWLGLGLMATSSNPDFATYDRFEKTSL